MAGYVGVSVPLQAPRPELHYRNRAYRSCRYGEVRGLPERAPVSRTKDTLSPAVQAGFHAIQPVLEPPRERPVAPGPGPVIEPVRPLQLRECLDGHGQEPFVPLSKGRPLALLPVTAGLVLAAGTTLGIAVLVLVAVPPAWRLQLRFRPVLRFPPGVARRAGGLALVGFAELVVIELASVVVIVLANGRGQTGAIVLFNYAWQVTGSVSAVLALSIVISAFPVLSARAGPAFDRTSAGSTRAVLLMSWLGTAVIAAIAIPAGHVLASQPGQVRQLIQAFALFAPGIAATAVITNLSRVMFVLGRLTVAAAALAGSWLLVITADVVLTGLVPSRLVVAALALGNTIGQTAAAIPMVFLTRRICGTAAVQGVSRAGAGRAGRRRGGCRGRRGRQPGGARAAQAGGLRPRGTRGRRRDHRVRRRHLPPRRRQPEDRPRLGAAGQAALITAADHAKHGTWRGLRDGRLYRVVHGDPALDRVPSEVRPLIERCLAKDPGRRPTADGLLAEVGALQPTPDWLPDSIIRAFAPDPGSGPAPATAAKAAAPAAAPGSLAALGSVAALGIAGDAATQTTAAGAAAQVPSGESLLLAPAGDPPTATSKSMPPAGDTYPPGSAYRQPPPSQPPPGASPGQPPPGGSRPQRRLWRPMVLVWIIAGMIAAGIAGFAVTSFAGGSTPAPSQSPAGLTSSAATSTAGGRGAPGVSGSASSSSAASRSASSPASAAASSFQGTSQPASAPASASPLTSQTASTSASASHRSSASPSPTPASPTSKAPTPTPTTSAPTSAPPSTPASSAPATSAPASSAPPAPTPTSTAAPATSASAST